LDSDSVAGAGNVSEELSDDSEELVPKAVHDLKIGKVQGKAGTHTLHLVEWEHYPTRLTGRGSRKTPLALTPHSPTPS
jgi:hypothetical protein